MKTIIKVLVLLSVALTATSCTMDTGATPPSIDHIYIGMSEAELLESMPNPTDSSTYSYGSGTYTNYSWYKFNNYSYDWDYYYSIDVHNGRVYSIYEG